MAVSFIGVGNKSTQKTTDLSQVTDRTYIWRLQLALNYKTGTGPSYAHSFIQVINKLQLPMKKIEDYFGCQPSWISFVN